LQEKTIWLLADWAFQQDNAPCHVSKKSIAFFQKQRKIPIEKWPPRSPDLNLIETIWEFLDRRLGQHSISSLDELSRLTALEWRALNKDRTLIKKLVNSMPDRVEAVIKAKGGVTKY